ncbi:unnamed protein product, partial [Meganyctiphanes norvegica]
WYRFCLLTLPVLGLSQHLPWKNSENVVKNKITSSGCEYPFQPLNSGCYFFSDVQMDFDLATSYCAGLADEHTHEVTLAMLGYDIGNDQALLQAVVDNGMSFWVGGKKGEDDQWVWQDGRDIYIDAPFWDLEEPDEVENLCMVIHPSNNSISRAFVYDHDCSGTVKAVCQAGNIKCPEGFIRIENYCYLQSLPNELPDRTWQEARDYCQALFVPEGYHADLAVLGLEDQDDYHSINNILPEGYHFSTWIGAYRDTECSYKWLDGRELPQESFYWSEDYPYCGEHDDHVIIYHQSSNNRAHLYDSIGDLASPFICQMYKDY